MANCMICWPNIEGTLSGGSWVSTLPLTNLYDDYVAKPARSSDLTEASTQFRVVFSDIMLYRVIALVGHNLSLSAEIRVIEYSDTEATTISNDSGWQQVWPSMFDVDSLEWEDDNFWSGTPSLRDLDNLPHTWIDCGSSLRSGGAIDIKFRDPYNEAGYVDLGSLFIARDWMPEHNMIYGSGIQWFDPSETFEAWNGAESHRQKRRYRVVNFSLDFMSDEEAINQALRLCSAGVTQRLLFIWDYEETAYIIQRTFLGRMLSLGQMSAMNYLTNGMTFQIKEVT